jgi:thiol-disulfide isomerase/thioredoxin
MNRGVLVALAIATAAAAGFFIQRQLQPANVAATSAPAVAQEPAEAEPKIPEILPDFLLVDRNGKKRSLKEWAGQPLMVNFWATWCGPCLREIPLLNRLRATHTARKLEIIGIAVDFTEDVLKYAETNPINYPVLIGEEDGFAAMKAFGMQSNAGLPFTFFADSKQRIVAMRMGELHQDQADLILEKLMAVDAGTLDLAVARQEITQGMKEINTRRALDKAANPKSD